MNANCGAIPLLDGANAAGVAPGAGPRKPLAFIIGQDSLLTFPTWHNYETILDNVHLIVCRRPGYPLTMAQEADQRGWTPFNPRRRALHNRPPA
jgi:nicotinate-nucleotide adenylyltransferase